MAQYEKQDWGEQVQPTVLQVHKIGQLLVLPMIVFLWWLSCSPDQTTNYESKDYNFLKFQDLILSKIIFRVRFFYEIDSNNHPSPSVYTSLVNCVAKYIKKSWILNNLVKPSCATLICISMDANPTRPRPSELVGRWMGCTCLDVWTLVLFCESDQEIAHGKSPTELLRQKIKWMLKTLKLMRQICRESSNIIET